MKAHDSDNPHSDASARLLRLRSQIEKLCRGAGNAGLSIGVARNGREIYHEHFGVVDVDSDETPDSLTTYHLASLSKALVAAGLAVFVEEGRISWNEPLKKILPGFRHRNEDVDTQSTLIDLLAHRMGLAMRIGYWAQMKAQLLVPASEAINVLNTLPETSVFRETINYNNWTYSVAGDLIEALSGMSLESFMHERFFKPLHLTRTTFGKPCSKNYSSFHMTLNSGNPCRVPRSQIGNGSVLAGAAGMKSCTADLLRLYTAFISAYRDQASTGRTKTPGNPFVQTAMLTTAHAEKSTTQCGLGWLMTDLPGPLGFVGLNDSKLAELPIIGQGLPRTRVVYHNGSLPGALSSVHLVPNEELVVVVLSNTFAFADMPDLLGGLVLNTVLGATSQPDLTDLVEEAKRNSMQIYSKVAAELRADRRPGTQKKRLLEYVGSYISAEGILKLDVHMNGSGLRMFVQGNPDVFYDLEHHHDNVFAWDCDRDADVRRAMFPQVFAEIRKISFLTDNSGQVNAIHWVYAKDEPNGEVFRRTNMADGQEATAGATST